MKTNNTKKTNNLSIERKIKAIAGFSVFITALLGYIHNEYWLYVTMFIGLNLFQFAFTNFCPLKNFLEWLEK